MCDCRVGWVCEWSGLFVSVSVVYNGTWAVVQRCGLCTPHGTPGITGAVQLAGVQAPWAQT